MEKAIKMTVMMPTVSNVDGTSENVASETLLCRSKVLRKYNDCPDYNTEFCRTVCEDGMKEKPVFADDDILLPDIESDK